MDLSEYPELMTGKQVAEVLGIDLSTLWEWRGDPSFPKPVRTPGHPRWRKRDLRQWVERLSSEPKLRRAM